MNPSGPQPLGSRRAEGDTHKQAHVQLPHQTFEREIGREGFFGQSTHMYHQQPPTAWIDWQGPLRPRAFDCNKLNAATPLSLDFDLDNTPFKANQLLFNQHLQLHYWTLLEPMQCLCRNGDGDWLLFVHEGAGDLWCDYGQLSLVKGDYCVIPKGTLWRLSPTSSLPMTMLLIESTDSQYMLPDKGILGPHAIFDPALMQTPSLNDAFKAQYTTPLASDNSWRVLIKKRNQLSQVTFKHNPLDAVGWHGDLMPVKINVSQIRPIVSHRYHLPPSAHTTFVTPHFVICTFTPRPFETDPEALKIPFFHSNDDYDEVIFYHQGDFFSRDHIEPGMITFHPAGFTHGPHPKALGNMLKQSKPATDEYAVMIDSRAALDVGISGPLVENVNYVNSWQSPAALPKNT